MRFSIWPGPKVIAKERKAAEQAVRDKRCQVENGGPHKGRVMIDRKMARPIAACAECRRGFRET